VKNRGVKIKRVEKKSEKRKSLSQESFCKWASGDKCYILLG